MADEAAPILDYAKTTIGATVIGFSLSTALYGVSFLQAYLYFRAYWKDSIGYKSLVATLITLDTLTTMLVAHGLYTMAVLHFNDPAANLILPWSFPGQAIAIDFTTIIAQLFYVHQIWIVSRNKPIIALVVLCALLGFMGDFSLNVLSYVTVNGLTSKMFLIVGSLTNSFLALADMLITGTLSYYLRSFRSASRERTNGTILDKLIIYTVSRGTITAVVQILFLAIYVAWPSKSYWIPFQLILGKLYVNSVLATLNVRRNLFAPDHAERDLHLRTDLDTKSMGMDAETRSGTTVDRA